jgi:hypothetical protein
MPGVTTVPVRPAAAPSPGSRPRFLIVVIALVVCGVSPSSLRAQTDYYNTDRGRPVQVEDAYSTERNAFELKLAPVKLERSRSGLYEWEVEPEIAYGILPRTHIEVGLPIHYTDLGGGARRSGIGGLDLSLMHNLNTESRFLPALGARADLAVPVGLLAPERAIATFTGMATRTFTWMRFHLNGQYSPGAAPAGPAGGTTSPLGRVEKPRWFAGLAADKVFPLRSFLITAEVFAQQSMRADAIVNYNVGTGVRYQWSPTLALDAGVGHRLTGSGRPWYVTFGSAYAFGLASFISGD